MRKLLLAAVVAAVLISGVVYAADWPAFRGLDGSGIAQEKIPNKNWNQKPPTLLWKVAMSDDGYAGPSMANGKVFIIDHQDTKDYVRALDIKTGIDVWFYAYDDATSSNFGFSRSTPLVNGGMVYTVSRWGILLCLNVTNGHVVWWKNLINEFGGRRPDWDYAWSPLIDGNKLIILPGGPNAGVVALDKRDGKVLWQSVDGEVPGYATPVVATILGKKQYVCCSNDNVYGMDAATGAKLWSFPWKNGSGISIATPLVIGNKVFVTGGYEHGCAMVEITMDGPKGLWENKEMQSHMASPIYFNGYIYGNSDPAPPGFLVCLDPATGAVLWKQPGFEKGPLVAADGVMIAVEGGTGAHVMVKLAPQGYQELGRFTPLGGQSWTAPIIANGKLITRNKATLACYDLK